jgi:Raffinose synthase or seed imbibition protein Sip1
LNEHGVAITNLLIDDNWQSLDHAGASQFERGWTDFEANEEGFPDKLRGLTADIRHCHPTIEHIGVWHGVFGYWGGVAPDGSLAKKYRTKPVHKERDYCDIDSFTVIKGEDASQMFDDFYKFLRESGVDSAKADTRYLLDCLSASNDRRDLIRSYNNAWLSASAKHLSMRVISCMAMIPQLLFSPELLFKSQYSQKLIIMRISDDFFPEIDSSHLWHIFWNAHNALLTQHLNILPDWDMFQTTHDYSAFHAAARCVSGGSIYITDSPGQHNLLLIKQLVAITPSRRSMILRASRAEACTSTPPTKKSAFARSRRFTTSRDQQVASRSWACSI